MSEFGVTDPPQFPCFWIFKYFRKYGNLKDFQRIFPYSFQKMCVAIALQLLLGSACGVWSICGLWEGSIF